VAARALLDQHYFTAFVVDVRLDVDDNDGDNSDGLDVVSWIRDRHPALPGVIITGWTPNRDEARKRFDDCEQVEIYDKANRPQWQSALERLARRSGTPPRPHSALERSQAQRPAARPTVDGPPTPSHSGALPSTGTLMIVENEEYWQTPLSQLCEASGYKVIQARDATDAAQQISTFFASSLPLLAIVDLHLPMSGVQEPTEEGLALLDTLRDRGIYSLVVSGHLKAAQERLSGRHDIVRLIDKKRFTSPEEDGRAVFLDAVHDGVARAMADRRAEGRLPEHQTRLACLPELPAPASSPPSA
jgi:CheY-like chemotaxis protein